MSPGLAGEAPATTLGSATIDPVPPSSAAMLVEFGKVKNAGENACKEFIVATGLFTPLLAPGFNVTVSITGPVPVNSGICALICPGLTYVMGNDTGCVTPGPVTCTPKHPNSVGYAPFTQSPGP